MIVGCTENQYIVSLSIEKAESYEDHNKSSEDLSTKLPHRPARFDQVKLIKNHRTEYANQMKHR